jgi:molybdenum cofactor biosynthesis enzyme MoaA
MMAFFFAGYTIIAVNYFFIEKTTLQDFLTSLIFFFGAVFVLSMVTMVRRMFTAITDKAELKKQLRQQELITNISRNFTMAEDPFRFINDVLRMSGELMKVNHTFCRTMKKIKLSWNAVMNGAIIQLDLLSEEKINGQ